MLDKPWTLSYDAEVPASLDYPDWMIQDYLIQAAEKFPHQIAVIYGDYKITYRQLLKCSREFGAKLIRMGLVPGDKVTICLPNHPLFVVAYYGILFGGGIVAAINPSFPTIEMSFQMQIVQPRFVIGDKTRLQDYEEVSNLNASRIITFDLNGTTEDQILAFVHDTKENGTIETHPHLKFPEMRGDAAAMLQFSGGTTGIPKAALVLHRNINANILQFTRWLTTMEYGREVFLTAIPLYHVYGMVIGLNVGIAMGASIVLVNNAKDIGSIVHTIQKHSVSFFPGVPSIYHSINLYCASVEEKVDLSSIKACISGSAPLMAETRIQFEKLTGGKLVEGYGLSEAPTATHCNPIKGENRNGSIGLPLPDVDCRIVEPSTLFDVETGQIGELLIRSPQVMAEYHQNPQETSLALVDGWLRTGDMARLDEAGYFYIVGRLKEMIKVHGMQVWPAEVENVLLQCEGIREVAVAGIPDLASGESVKAWIVAQPDFALNFDRIKGQCHSLLASYKIPKHFEIVDQLPKSLVGKILRRELVRKELEKK